MLAEKKAKIDVCLKSIAKGNTDRVEDLYDLVQANLFFIALKYMGDRDKAEDLLSDFWCDIVKIAKKYLFFVDPFGYLCKVLTNRALTRLKKEGRVKKNEAIVTAEFLEKYEAICDVDYLYSENIRSLRDAVKKGFSYLSEKEKIVIYLTYWEGKTVRECAEEMGVSKSTADRLKSSATEKLKDVLAKEGWDEKDETPISVFERAAVESGGENNG